MAKTITLKFEGKCADCGATLPVGSTARWYGRGRVYGFDCHTKETSSNQKINTVYFPSTGGFVYQNSKGRCEDAPCCGCCGDENTRRY